MTRQGHGQTVTWWLTWRSSLRAERRLRGWKAPRRSLDSCRRSFSEVASPKRPSSRSDAMMVAVRLQPTEPRMDCGRVASATLENVLPCSRRSVLLVVILGLGNVAAMCRGLFFNPVVRGRNQASLRDACQFRCWDPWAKATRLPSGDRSAVLQNGQTPLRGWKAPRTGSLERLPYMGPYRGRIVTKG
jgi:hypothetical protein